MPRKKKGSNGFSEHKEMFLHIVDTVHKIDEKVNEMSGDLKLLKYKSSVWGAIAGGAVLVITTLGSKVSALFGQ